MNQSNQFQIENSIPTLISPATSRRNGCGALRRLAPPRPTDSQRHGPPFDPPPPSTNISPPSSAWITICLCSLDDSVSISFCTARVPCVLSAMLTSSPRSAPFFNTCAAAWCRLRGWLTAQPVVAYLPLAEAGGSYDRHQDKRRRDI